jgi:hypothetical protein
MPSISMSVAGSVPSICAAPRPLALACGGFLSLLPASQSCRLAQRQPFARSEPTPSPNLRLQGYPAAAAQYPRSFPGFPPSPDGGTATPAMHPGDALQTPPHGRSRLRGVWYCYVSLAVADMSMEQPRLALPCLRVRMHIPGHNTCHSTCEPVRTAITRHEAA